MRSSTRLFMDPYRSTEGATTYLIVADAGAVREGIRLHESLEDVGEGEVADEDVVGGEGNVVVVLDGDVQGDHVSVSEDDALRIRHEPATYLRDSDGAAGETHGADVVVVAGGGRNREGASLVNGAARTGTYVFDEVVDEEELQAELLGLLDEKFIDGVELEDEG